MDKQRLCIEHELTSNSTAIIWDLISTDSGLARWMADSVTQEGEQLTEMDSLHSIWTDNLARLRNTCGI